MRFTKTIASATVAAVLGLAGVSVAGAAANTGSTGPASTSTTAKPATPQAPAATKKPAAKKARIARRRHLAREAVKLSAKTIGIKPADLVAQLRSGKTIAEVAAAHNVSAQTVINALEVGGTAKIKKAEAAGKIDAARAAKLEQRLDKLAPKFVNDWHLKAKASAPAAG